LEALRPAVWLPLAAAGTSWSARHAFRGRTELAWSCPCEQPQSREGPRQSAPLPAREAAMAPWHVPLPVAQRLGSAAAAAAAGVLASAALTGTHGPLTTARADDSSASASPSAPGGVSNLGAVLGFPRVHGALQALPHPWALRRPGTPAQPRGQAPRPLRVLPPAPLPQRAAQEVGAGSGLGGARKLLTHPSEGPYQSPGVAPPGPPPAAAGSDRPRNTNPNPRDTAAGFDPEALERGARALREIDKSASAKQASLGFCASQPPPCALHTPLCADTLS